MQQDDQVPRALVEHAKVSVAKSHPELAQHALDLRGDRERRRRSARRIVIQMLLDVIVDLGGLLSRQRLDEPVDGLIATLVAVVDGLGPSHGPSMSSTSAGPLGGA